MRAAADPDAFPAADLGLRRALARLGAPPGHAARWRPWRAYAAMHLWTWPAEADAAWPADAAATRRAEADAAWPADAAALAPAG